MGLVWGAAPIPRRRHGFLSASLRRRDFSRWLLAQVRSRRMSFASPSPTPSTAAGGDALTVARRARALDALARTTAAVQADLLTADRSGPQGRLRHP